jgi:predicted transcriptional regulator
MKISFSDIPSSDMLKFINIIKGGQSSSMTETGPETDNDDLRLEESITEHQISLIKEEIESTTGEPEVIFQCI